MLGGSQTVAVSIPPESAAAAVGADPALFQRLREWRSAVARTEGIVLRYLASAYKALEHTIPDDLKSEDLEDLIAWLGEMVRQVDSSLLDEWEQLANPEVETAEQAQERADEVKPVTANARAFRVLVRNAMFRRVELVARDDLDGLMALERAAADRTEPARAVVMTRSAWDTAIEDYYAEHDSVGTAGDARGPSMLVVEPTTGEPAGAPEDTVARLWQVRQVIADPEGHHDWVIDGIVDLDASDEAGELAATFDVTLMPAVP